MKQFLATALISLVTGIAFAGGILVVAHLFTKYEGSAYEPTETIYSPDGVTIESHSFVENMPQFTVQGVIDNTSDNNFQNLELKITLRADQSIVNTCEPWIKGLAANSRKAFTVECVGVAGTDLPTNINYDIEIGEGWIRKPCD